MIPSLNIQPCSIGLAGLAVSLCEGLTEGSDRVMLTDMQLEGGGLMSVLHACRVPGALYACRVSGANSDSDLGFFGGPWASGWHNKAPWVLRNLNGSPAWIEDARR